MWLIFAISLALAADPEPEEASKHAVGSSLFVLANLVPMDNPPSFYQFNYQYRVTPTDVLSVEAITWKYNAPLGIPWGSEMEHPRFRFPGAVRAYGVGAAYKRYLWKDLYTAIHGIPMYQLYLDEGGDVIQRGFQLFVTARVGYHLELFRDRVFVEPSVAMTSWPINTNLPPSFTRQEEKWPSYFLLEPGLHFGVNF